MRKYNAETGRKETAKIVHILLAVFGLLCLLLAACGEAPAAAPTEKQQAAPSSAAPKTTAAAKTTAAEPGTLSPDLAGADAPKAVIDPALTGKWGFHVKQSEDFEVDIVWTFNADGTGSMYSQGITIPIVSYVATQTAYTEYPEDGYLITVYWGEMKETMGDTVITTTMDPTEYGYLFHDGL